MRSVPNSIVALLISCGLLAVAGGLQMTLISVRAGIEQYSSLTIGLLVSGYYFGLLLGCLLAARVVARVGHTRAFLALAGIFSATMLSHIVFLSQIFWILLRVIVGASLAGLYMIIESWLNDKADDSNRGRVLGLYRFIELSALTTGQLLLGVFAPEGYKLFCLVAIFISLSLVPLALSRAEGPSPITNAEFRWRALLEISPVATIGCLMIGLASSNMFGLGPIFAQSAGLTSREVGIFMSVMIVGGALAQVPLGRLSDRMDRRVMLAIVALAAAATAAFMTATLVVGKWLLFVMAAVYGAFAMSKYSIVIAHANDRARPEQFVEISGSLMLVYAVGAIIGPALGSTAMGLFGDQWLFFVPAVFHGLLGLFALSRTFVRAGTEEGDKEHFVPVLRSTPEIFELDPRSENDESEVGESVEESQPS